MIRWIVRADYTFSDAGPSIEEVDSRVGGRVQHLGGGIMRSIGGGPFRTTLEWGFETKDDAKVALDALRTVGVIERAHAIPQERVLSPEEYQIRASEARAGRARCANCGSRIDMDPANDFALEGAGADNEILLRCNECGFVMGWRILPED